MHRLRKKNKLHPLFAELDEAALPDGKGFFYDRVSTPSAKT